MTSRDRGTLGLLALFGEEILDDLAMKRMGERQLHAIQNCWHEIKYLRLTRVVASFDPPTIGIEYTIFLMCAMHMTGLFPQVPVAQVHAEGDSLCGQHQQVRLMKRELTLAIALLGVDGIHQ